MRVDLANRLSQLDLREFGISALFAALVLFVAAMLMLNQNVAQLRRSFAWVERAHLIQKRIDDVNNLTNNVEMTVRGYALTGDAKFLDRHGKTHAALMTAVSALDTLMAREAAFGQDRADLKSAVDDHEALYASLIGHGPAEQALVAEAITNPAKRRLKERVTSALSRIEAAEQGIHHARSVAAEREARSTYTMALAIAGIAFVCGMVGFALTLFGKRRERAREEAKP